MLFEVRSAHASKLPAATCTAAMSGAVYTARSSVRAVQHSTEPSSVTPHANPSPTSTLAKEDGGAMPTLEPQQVMVASSFKAQLSDLPAATATKTPCSGAKPAEEPKQ